ncbi:MAG TPA: hypothetical protein IAC63_01830 [Candidatus Enterousia avicola]|uniref:Uncharacterized protein n=1 Tax=Candidatus Enterousia avicola TaxID=2840787 RepID=A0A9D1SMG5_9PROT|nr:hypothetical protein [Candidatus Enterousia avicola]
MNQDNLIQSLLDKMHAIFDRAAGPNNRVEYMRQHNVSGIDWHFSLSADDIIKQKIPRAVAGCTGISKVFSKLATEAGLKHVVLTTARIADLNGAEQDRKDGKKERVINGHQIIAVYDEKGNLRAFDPGRKELGYIKSEIKVGNIGGVVPHRITAILTPQEFSKVNTYKKLRDLYVYGSDGKKKQDFLKGKNTLSFWEKLQKYFVQQND